MPASSSRFRRLTVHAPLLVPLSNLTMLQVTSLNEICTPEVQSVPTQERGIVWEKWRLCNKLFFVEKPSQTPNELDTLFPDRDSFSSAALHSKMSCDKIPFFVPGKCSEASTVLILDESSDSVNPLEQWDIEH